MVAWFYRGLRRGVVTSRYPRAVDAWAAGLPGPPAFHSARLTRGLAERLVTLCPAAALAVEGDRLVLDVGRCTGCGRCVAAGEGAVTRSGEFELATGDRRALVKWVPIGDDEETGA